MGKVDIISIGSEDGGWLKSSCASQTEHFLTLHSDAGKFPHTLFVLLLVRFLPPLFIFSLFTLPQRKFVGSILTTLTRDFRQIRRLVRK